VFARVGARWSQRAKLTASRGAARDNFGYSVAIYGSTVVVGAYGKNSFRGTAYVFVRSDRTWSRQATLTASDGFAGDQFGYSVALHGSTAVVGAPAKNSFRGAAYVFARSGTHWSRQATLSAHSAAFDEFGCSVALYGPTAVVGADGKRSFTGAAYVFARSGTHWSRQAELTASHAPTGDQFGYSVALSGSRAVIGAYGKNFSRGAAYVFARSGAHWSQRDTLTASHGARGDQFGWSVALYGSRAVVGAPFKTASTGAAYVIAGL
jgi:hypothetical protein